MTEEKSRMAEEKKNFMSGIQETGKSMIKLMYRDLLEEVEKSMYG